MKKAAWIVFLFCPVIIYAQVNIIPQLAEVKMGKGFYAIDKKVQVAYDVKTKRSAQFLADYLTNFYKIKCQLTSDLHGAKAILLMSGPVNKKGEYKLKIDKSAISIAGDEEGVFYGVQTLIQLLPVNNNKLQVPFVSINDYPRFAYRGMHLDAGRHFF